MLDHLDIILIEDNDGDVRLVEELLTNEVPGLFSMQSCATLSDGIEMLGNGFDVVLLDLGLPDSTGLETADRVLSVSDAPPVVVLSGADYGVAAIEAVHRGAQDYVSKLDLDGRLLWKSLCFAVERAQLIGDPEEPEPDGGDPAWPPIDPESSAYALLCIDSEMRITRWNAAAERLLGCTGDMLGRLCAADLLAGDEKPDLMDRFEIFARSGYIRAAESPQETDIVRPDGSTARVRFMVFPYRADDRWCLTAVLMDVTESHGQRNRTEEQREMLVETIDALTVPVVLVESPDRSGDPPVITANPAAMALAGIESRRPSRGTRVSDLMPRDLMTELAPVLSGMSGVSRSVQRSLDWGEEGACRCHLTRLPCGRVAIEIRCRSCEQPL